MQKAGFSGYFPVFSAGKVCLLKIRLCQILGIAISHQCAEFHEEIINYNPRNPRKTVFSAIITVPVIFRKFQLQKSVLLTIFKSCLMVGIVIINVLCEKTKKYKKKVQ